MIKPSRLINYKDRCRVAVYGHHTYNEFINISDKIIRKTISSFERKFDIEIANLQTSLRFLSSKNFSKKHPDAEEWVSGIYYWDKRTIDIRMPTKDVSEILAHEITHAITDHISEGRCPGWIGEGLSVIYEKKLPEVYISEFFKMYSEKREFIPLNLLQGSYMGLENNLVYPAYGQSYLFVVELIKTFGAEKLINFLFLLGKYEETEEEILFEQSYGINISEFEDVLKGIIMNRRKFKTDIKKYN